jgi:predicted nucleotidyltransferase
MKIKLILLLCLNLLLITNVDAQRKKTKKKTTTTEKKADVIVFGSDDEEEEDSTQRGSNQDIIIKTSPTSFIFGLGLIEVEKELSGSFSAQIGLGVTFDSKLRSIQNILDDNDDVDYPDFSTNWSEDIFDNYVEERATKLGYMFSISPRIFYAGDGFEGTYLSPTFSYRKNNFTVPQIIKGQREVIRDAANTDTESVTYKDVMIRYGTQKIYSAVTTEFFIGMGLRFITSERQDLGYNDDGNIDSAFLTFKRSTFAYDFGLRIGYHF